MAVYIAAALRQLVRERAAVRCEYCQIPEAFVLHRHEPDHIVPVQHGGTTDEENLALACLRCNRYKGPNIGSFDPTDGKLVTLFNPRLDRWDEHFAWDGARILPRTPRARVTVKLLRLNDVERLSERERLIQLGVDS